MADRHISRSKGLKKRKKPASSQRVTKAGLLMRSWLAANEGSARAAVAVRMCMPPVGGEYCLQSNHLKIFLTGPTFRASPVNGNVFPSRTGSNALIRQTGFFVVDPTTDQAHPGLEFCFAIAHG